MVSNATKTRLKNFRAEDFDLIIPLLAKGYTEAEACRYIGRRPESWYIWKCKNKHQERIANGIARARLAETEFHLANIRQAAVGGGPHKRADWRASEFEVRRLNPQWFEERSATTTAPAIGLALIESALTKALAAVAAQKALPAPTVDIESKQTESPATIEATIEAHQPQPLNTPTTPDSRPTGINKGGNSVMSQAYSDDKMKKTPKNEPDIEINPS
jgi:hypothetical protein